ncbi:Uncharacterised protein [Phocoenobacter uteri]|uniref:Uncharacterized protein n=1 Tax=Phocoenobacter uteri TaxID=146806 RepID=A0A379CBP7_9PAST|nr:hypothetical protein [Phocoenobacter uteri]MDG6881076.1 hypothetical protein [Phocoenobacter uteri]SUB59097.1 Uncharacterised protein [Phocoenobacter uteri]
MKINSWRALREQMLLNEKKKHTPKTKQDWFLLRDRWARYTPSHRAFVLKVAGIPETEDWTAQDLANFSKEQINAISWAIRDIKTYAHADNIIYEALTRVLKRVLRKE